MLRCVSLGWPEVVRFERLGGLVASSADDGQDERSLWRSSSRPRNDETLIAGKAISLTAIGTDVAGCFLPLRRSAILMPRQQIAIERIKLFINGAPPNLGLGFVRFCK